MTSKKINLGQDIKLSCVEIEQLNSQSESYADNVENSGGHSTAIFGSLGPFPEEVNKYRLNFFFT